MRYKDFKIGTKLNLGFGLVICILFLTGVIIFNSLTNIKEKQLDASRSYVMADHMSEAKNCLSKEMQVVMELMASSGLNELNEWWNKHKEQIISYDQRITKLDNTVLDKSWGETHEDDKISIHEMLDEIEEEHNTLVLPKFEAMYRLKTELLQNEGLNKDSELNEIDEFIDESCGEMLEDLEQMEAIVLTIVQESEQALKLVIQKSETTIIVLIIVGLFLAIFFGYIVTRSITKPVQNAIVMANEVGNGNLTIEIKVTQNDEIGQLLSVLKQMAERLKEIVSNIKTGAGNISSASQQLSSTSQQISQGANEQASSVEEISSSIEEMAANIQQNSENANQTQQISQQSSSAISDGNSASENSKKAMESIADKITIINDIAFQTNILALNAAVEAARAGEHGKGFAVVAAEVRKLAERSRVAASEIDGLSKNGVNISKVASEKLASIVPEIEKTTQLINEITAASNEMSGGAAQINNAIQQLNCVTQQNASASEEMAAGAEELSSQAQTLLDAISYFKTNNGNEYFTDIKNKVVIRNEIAPLKQEMVEKF